MRSFYYLAILIALGNFASVVQSAPLPLQIGTIYGHNDLNNNTPRPLTVEEQEHANNIHVATAQAHEQVLHMQNLLNQPDEIAHPHLVNAFGEGYNKAMIKATVDHLAAGTIHIGNVNQPNVGESERHTAETWGSQTDHPRISLMSKFHEMNPDARAGTIIHEATHAIDDTRDLFSAHPSSPNKFMPLHPQDEANKRAQGHDVKAGYHHDSGTGELTQDFKDLRNNAGKVMHKNADSFKVLAHTATHGLGTNPPAPFPPVHPKAPCPPGKKCTIL